MSNRIAVIITTYNSPEYLDKVLAGHGRQIRLPDEILVADDGSGPATAETVRRWQGRLACPVRHVWHEDRGFRAGAIRNEAVRRSACDYLVFTDGDCVPHPRFIEDHLALAKPGRFIQGKRMLVGEAASDGFTGSSLAELLRLCLQGRVSGCHHLLRLPWVSLQKNGLSGIKTCNFAVHRSDFEAVNGFNEEYVGWGREDADLALRLMNNGVSRCDVPFGALVYHLWHRENSRQQLEANDARLGAAAENRETWCRNGLKKEEP